MREGRLGWNTGLLWEAHWQWGPSERSGKASPKPAFEALLCLGLALAIHQ